MLSGAISSAPRWSVVGLTGKATPWSRLSSSRPPPEATDETTVSNKNPAKTVGQQQHHVAGLAVEVARRPAAASAACRRPG